MGRKIPAKKHRGVKDPLEQQAKRLQSLKGKINAPPRDPDEQPVPRSLERLFAPRAGRPPPRPSAAGGSSNNIKIDKGKSTKTAVSVMRRAGGESAREFSQRITSAVRALHHPAPMQYPQDTEAEDVKGERMEALRERRRRRALRAGGGAGAGRSEQAPSEPKLSRSQKRALKLKAKKDKITESKAVEAVEVRYERVQFGDVAAAPPALLAPRRAPPGADRPGRRNLLLSAMLPGGAAAARAGAGAGAGAGASAEARERARLDAVAAYRALKASKIKQIKLKR